MAKEKGNRARVAILNLPQKIWKNPMTKRIGARAQRIRAQSKLIIRTEGTGNNCCTKQSKVETEIAPILLPSESDEEQDLHKEENTSSDDCQYLGKTDYKEKKRFATSKHQLVTYQKRKCRRYELEDQSEVLKDRMLGANVVNVSQNHLKAQFDNISGFEDTSLGPHLAFTPVKQDSFIQILHDGDKHWVCVSNIGCTGGTVRLFDSIFTGIKRSIVRQIASIIYTELLGVNVVVEQVQQQTNSIDCGINAIAFATSLLSHQDPCLCCYDEDKLRPHLNQCLTNKYFPHFHARKTLATRRQQQTHTGMKLDVNCAKFQFLMRDVVKT